MTSSRIDPVRIEEAAARASGGGELRHVPGGRDAWRVLTRAIAAEADLTPRGEAWARGLLFRERLRADFVARLGDPGPLQTPTVLVTGLARSGTTALHRLVARSFAAGHLRASATRSFGLRGFADQDFAPKSPAAALHRFDAGEAEECDGLFLPTFRSLLYSGYFHVPTYGEWLRSGAMVDAYPAYARSAYIAQREESPARWVVKSPSHLGFIPAVRNVYPVSLTLWVVRPALETVASAVDLARRFRAATCRRPWTESDTLGLIDTFVSTVERALSDAGGLPSGAIRCVPATRLRNDPARLIREIALATGWDERLVVGSASPVEPTAPERADRLSRVAQCRVGDLEALLGRAVDLFGHD